MINIKRTIAYALTVFALIPFITGACAKQDTGVTLGLLNWRPEDAANMNALFAEY
jgi:hypothetical protein